VVFEDVLELSGCLVSFDVFSLAGFEEELASDSGMTFLPHAIIPST
jgi:hypothetical protein